MRWVTKKNIKHDGQTTYMDDSMESMENEDEAVELVQQLKKLWRKVGCTKESSCQIQRRFCQR